MSRPSLTAAYAGITAVLDDCGDDDLSRPTRAAGWGVRDLLLHLLLDAQRALVTVATPADRPPDRDRYDYWRDFPPGRPGADAHADLVRRVATAYGDRALSALWRETAPAAAHAVDVAEADEPVATQGHVLSVADLASTLVVEATVHHLDLVVDLAGAPGPPARGLAEVRDVLEGLLGAPFPPAWSDERTALVGTGREAPTPEERADLGHAADRLPLLA